MKQRTVKRAVEAWNWIHNNEHHLVATEWPRSIPEYQQTMDNRSHIIFANHHEKMRVPIALAKEVFEQLKANTRKFDTRMYALRSKAKAMVGPL